jgi:hypothetical protein
LAPSPSSFCVAAAAGPDECEPVPSRRQGRSGDKAKNKCRKRRNVVIKRVGGRPIRRNEVQQGRPLQPRRLPGIYVAKAKQKKNGKFICKKAKSKPVSVP